MGDHGQSLTRTDLSVDEAQRVVVDLRGWLVEEGVITAEIDDGCVFGISPGHRPGPNWASIVELEWHEPHFLELQENGVKIEGGVPGIVCYPNGAELASNCPLCGSDIYGGFVEAIDDWMNSVVDGARPPVVHCPSCGEEPSILECVLDDSWSLSLVEVTFCNWGKLSAPFETEVLKRLGGNSRVIRGKS